MELSRIVDASVPSVNLVPCPAPVIVGDLPPGLVSVDDFHAETFQDSRIGPWRPGHIHRYAPAGAPGLDVWGCHELHLENVESTNCASHGHINRSLNASFDLCGTTLCRCF